MGELPDRELLNKVSRRESLIVIGSVLTGLILLSVGDRDDDRSAEIAEIDADGRLLYLEADVLQSVANGAIESAEGIHWEPNAELHLEDGAEIELTAA